jgi:hypothetical protein
MAQLGYVQGVGIWYPSELKAIKKKDGMPLQPIFEAFTNALEAIFVRKARGDFSGKGEINMCLCFSKGIYSTELNQLTFQKVTIEDSGIGFDDLEYERFKTLRDDRKHFSNKGTGRIQFIHFFDTAKISSIYKDDRSSTGYRKRVITLSKNDAFLDNRAIVRLDSEIDIEATGPLTILTLETVLEKKEQSFFSTLTAEEVKEQLIQHYLSKFCDIRDDLPQIVIKSIIDGEVKETMEITPADIPTPDKERSLEVCYSVIRDNSIEQIPKTEDFHLRTFLIPEKELKRNEFNLVSKGETAKKMKLERLLPEDVINGNRYLFLLSGKYIEERDGDTRGEISIPLRRDFRKRDPGFYDSEEEILLEDIEEKTNETIHSLYGEISEKYREKEKNIDELQEMFLLSPTIMKSLRKKIHIDDTDETILQKVYKADAEIIATKDAKIRQHIKDIEQLTPGKSDDYQNQLKSAVNNFVKLIPLQNRTALTQYVARRKIVLELFQKVLDKEIDNLKNGGRIDEAIMHNLIFQQGSDHPEDSELWLINEDYIYFKGCSETELCKVKYNNAPLFKEKFSEEEERYLRSLGENRKMTRPDVLLFPEEGKCIIVELKAPDVNVSDHLMQINKYANLILNYSREEFGIKTFYGYLIGEGIEDRDVLGMVSSYQKAYNLGYLFKPSEPVIGFDGRKDGGIYTEVIKYTTLLERAKLRNKIFIDKLDHLGK